MLIISKKFLINFVFILYLLYISDANHQVIHDEDDKEEVNDNKKKNKKAYNDKRKKASLNQIPKEKNINEGDAEIASIVIELHAKWHCNEHQRSCYIDLTRHITLTTNHLSTWARSIVRL